jgi:histidyl-tRNA synthetase
MSRFKTVRGMRDFLPEEAMMIRYVEATARTVAELYGYKEIMTPLVESYELLSAKAGEDVKSRMFVFKDLGGRNVALRPEFTASVARVVATVLKNEPKPLRLFCAGTVYRYDEPQRGRYREFWQSNYELMGSSRPEADAEILMLTKSLMESAGLKRFAFKIGHVGVLRGLMEQEKLDEKGQNAVMQLMDKKQYNDALRLAEKAGASDKCAHLLRELVELKGQKVFEVADKLRDLVNDYEQCVEAVENLREILRLFFQTGAKLDMTVEAGFARGLEYYTGMIFEVYVPDMDIALAGGGRYDRLIELYGGESTPAVGVAHGLDRIMMAVKMQGRPSKQGERESVMVIPIKDETKGEALKIAEMLRDSGLAVEVDVTGRKMAKSLEDADRRSVGFAVIVGERELKEGAVVVRDLVKRQQNVVKIKDIVKTLKDLTCSSSEPRC